MLPMFTQDDDDELYAFDYVQTTQGVTVRAQPEFLEDESEPENHKYLWAYTIRIENDRADEIALLARRWRITDARGRTEKVEGEGVVGEQPTIGPGESFEYTSCAPLSTASGMMDGSYVFRVGSELERIPVPQFSLDSPFNAALIN